MDKGTFEYEIRKDFRNNQIVREVDERRLRDLWQSLAVGAALVIVLLFSAWQHFELLRHGYKLEQMQRERAAESDINRHLRLENETLRAPQRIEKLATERLGMVAPGDAEAVVLERVARRPGGRWLAGILLIGWAALAFTIALAAATGALEVRPIDVDFYDYIVNS